MKYFDMLRGLTWMRSLKEQNVVTPATETVLESQITQQESVLESFTINPTANEEVLGILRDIKEQMIARPANGENVIEESTLLNEEEVSNVLDILIEFQDKYFETTPISQTLVKGFIWNIPRHIYELAMKAYNEGLPACLNPLYWFYPFCINQENIDIGFFNVIATANLAPDEDYQELCDRARDYETMWNEANI